jgi:ABC-type polysaccharide/polyol phosphate export permease
MPRAANFPEKCLNWMALGWRDIKTRYRRTIIGPFWIVLNTALSIAFLGFVYRAIFKLPPRQYLPYIGAGIIIWTFLASNIAESCGAYINLKFLLQGIPFRPELILFRLTSRNAIIFLHNGSVMLVLLVVARVGFTWQLLLTLPGFLLVNVFAVTSGVILAYACARFRDLMPFAISLLAIIFLVTPVIWPVELLGDRKAIALLNPFTHYIAIIREPLLGRSPAAISWLIAAGLCIVLGVVAVVISNRYSRRMIYWL